VLKTENPQPGSVVPRRCYGWVRRTITITCNHRGIKVRIVNQLENIVIRLHNDEAGQGIVEYMLIIALVAFAATAGMSSLASGVNSAMTKIASVLGVYIS